MRGFFKDDNGLWQIVPQTRRGGPFGDRRLDAPTEDGASGAKVLVE